MTNFKKIALTALIVCSALVSEAQVKLGHINVELLLSLMPETKKADSQLEALGKTFQEEFNKMTTEYQTKMQRYQNEAAKQSEAINQMRAKEMQDTETRLQEYGNNAQQELQKKRLDLYQPIFKKAQDAIDAVAKVHALNYVFDTSKGTIIYESGSFDLIDEVKKKLGLN